MLLPPAGYRNSGALSANTEVSILTSAFEYLFFGELLNSTETKWRENMKIHQEHIDTLKRDGFVVIPNFLSNEEVIAAREGIHSCVAPDYQGYVAAGRKNTLSGTRDMFPWNHSGLLQAIAHPNLIDAAEQIHGSANLRLSNAYVGVKYGGDGDNPNRPDKFHNYNWHIDYENNILSPKVTDPARFHRYPVFLYYFTDVTSETSPVRMMPTGGTPEDGVDITGPAGTLAIYTQFTLHTATPFRDQASYRAAAWVQMAPADRMYDMPFFFGGSLCGEGMTRFISEASPRQLELLGFPPAGAPLWTPEFIAGMENRYPGFRGELYGSA